VYERCNTNVVDERCAMCIRFVYRRYLKVYMVYVQYGDTLESAGEVVSVMVEAVFFVIVQGYVVV
jgi:hypothetical protein